MQNGGVWERRDPVAYSIGMNKKEKKTRRRRIEEEKIA